MGVLVGQGYSPEKAYETVKNWERIRKENRKLHQPNASNKTIKFV